ncbi:hypothetical protein ACJX0J_016150, partial [Zea mays]
FFFRASEFLLIKIPKLGLAIFFNMFLIIMLPITAYQMSTIPCHFFFTSCSFAYSNFNFMQFTQIDPIDEPEARAGESIAPIESKPDTV